MADAAAREKQAKLSSMSELSLPLVARGFLRGILSLTFIAMLAGCAMMEQQGEKPVTGPVVPPAAPRVVGVDTLTMAEHKKLVAQFGGEYKWPAAEHYLNGILVKLAAASESTYTPYRVTILNTPIVNAFALASGNLYVSRGLLALANDSSEVAAVMAHEIAHVTARHAAARAERTRQVTVIAEAASIIQSRQKGEEVESAQRLSFASFSRQQEIDADKIGVAVIARAGYDPYGAVRFLSSLGRSTALRAELLGQKSPGKPNIMATHPSTPERIAQATLAARQIGAPGVGKSDREGYLAAIDGINFGEDPTDGLVRGNRFLQVRLNYAFTAPEGFILENTPYALLGQSADGHIRLRLDSVAADPVLGLDAYLASGWLDGLLQSSIKTGKVNDMPAAFAIARAGEWNFRVAVIQKNNEVYRVMFGVRALTPEAEQRFQTAIDSFHAMTAEESGKARAYKLKIIQAGNGDTLDTMSRRMAQMERPLETFLLLNELEANESIKADNSYKTVID